MRTKTLACVFPGQGAQSVGMLAEWIARSGPGKQALEQASGILDLDLLGLMADGPESKLAQTEITQPLMLAAGVAVWREWIASSSERPAFVAGHSLGEYTALVCAEAIAFEDALRLVKLRAECMQVAVPQGLGAMSAVIGLSEDLIEDLCAQVSDPSGCSVVAPANYNAPGQVVVAGHQRAVEVFSERALAAGARKVVPLAMSIPAHCILMKPAADALAPHLSQLKICVPHMPIVTNASVRVTQSPEIIREELYAQVSQPVRWIQVIQTLVERGVTDFCEVGPGKVLSSLIRRINKQVGVYASSTPKMFESAFKQVDWINNG